MISNVQREAIKKIIGKKHLKKILVFFKENNIKNREGKLYSHSFVNDIFNGYKSNDNIEKGIWACARHYIRLRQVERKKELETVDQINALVDESAA